MLFGVGLVDSIVHAALVVDLHGEETGRALHVAASDVEANGNVDAVDVLGQAVESADLDCGDGAGMRVVVVVVGLFALFDARQAFGFADASGGGI
jgi:hypothetical protein